jgi:hypothetical protein
MPHAPDISFEKAEALYRKLEKGRVIMQLFPDNSRVIRLGKKPPGVTINGLGFELRRGQLRFFRFMRGTRAELTNPRRAVQVALQ